MSEITIPAETAAHVLWQDNLGGWPPSTFSAKLLTAWTSADTANAERLAVGFPEHAAAIALVRSGQQGIETLQTIADGEHDGRVEGPDAPVDLSKWAAEITGDQLEPLDSSLSMQTSSGPLVRSSRYAASAASVTGDNATRCFLLPFRRMSSVRWPLS